MGDSLSHLDDLLLLGTLRFATARCCYGYEKSNLLPVTSAHALQYGFPAVPCFSTTAKYFLWRSPQYVSITFISMPFS